MTEWYRGPVLCCVQRDNAVYFGMGPVLYRTTRAGSEATCTVEPLPERTHLHGLALSDDGILAYGNDLVALLNDALQIQLRIRASGWILCGSVVQSSIVLVYVEGLVEWRTMAGDITKSMRLPTSINYVAACSTQGIAAAGPLGLIHVWREDIATMADHQGAVIALAWSQGDWEPGCLLSGGDDRCVRLWSTLTCEPVRCYGHLGKVTGVCFLGPPRVCSVGEDQKVILWANGLQEKVIELTAPLRCVSYDKMLVVGGDDGARLIDPEGARFVSNQWTLPTTEGPSDWVRSLFWFSCCAVVGTNFGRIHIVDTATSDNVPTIIRTISLDVVITAMAHADGIVYAGTSCGHLYRIELQTGTYSTIGAALPMRIHCVFALGNYVVTLTNQRISVFCHDNFHLDNGPKKLFSAAQSEHFLLFGDDVGYLWALDLRDRTFRSFQAHPNARILHIEVRSNPQEEVVTTGADGCVRRFIVGTFALLEAIKAPRSINQVVRHAREWIAGFAGADFVLCREKQDVLRVRCGGSRRPWAFEASSFLYAHKREILWHRCVGGIEDRRLGPDVPHCKDVYAALMTPHGLVTCSEDTKVCLTTADAIAAACVHPSTVKGLAFDPSRQVLYSCGAKGRLHSFAVHSHALVPEGDAIVWDEEGRLMAVAVLHGEPVCISSRGFIRRGTVFRNTQKDSCPLCLAIDATTNRMYVGTSVGCVEIFEGDDLRPIDTRKVHEGATTAILSLSHLITCSDDGTVACTNKITGERTAMVSAHVASARALLEIPGGCVASVGWDQKVCIFAVPSMTLLHTAPVAVTQPECLAWDNDIVVGGRGLERIKYCEKT